MRRYCKIFTKLLSINGVVWKIYGNFREKTENIDVNFFFDDNYSFSFWIFVVWKDVSRGSCTRSYDQTGH